MKNLKFAPSVGVIGDNYEIIVVTSCDGRCYVTVGDEDYYENSAGICRVHAPVHKIMVPQSALNVAKEYTVHFAECPEKKRYFTVLGDEENLTFPFRPLEKEENINIYYIADIHGAYDAAEKCCTFFGDDLDLLVINGDYGESSTREDIEAVNELVAKVTGGRVPVIIARGNHDTRGSYAECVPEYIPTDGEKTYYHFKFGPIDGIVLDSGEDKVDTHPEYGTVNYFQRYRKEEAKALSALDPLEDDKYRIAICHNPFNFRNPRDLFNIDIDTFTEWTRNIERIGTEVMICGHLHKYMLLAPGDDQCHIPHGYPIVVASKNENKKLGGTAITLMKDEFVFRFSDENHDVTDELRLPRK